MLDEFGVKMASDIINPLDEKYFSILYAIKLLSTIL
jgi:hypothetical protein